MFNLIGGGGNLALLKEIEDLKKQVSSLETKVETLEHHHRVYTSTVNFRHCMGESTSTYINSIASFLDYNITAKISSYAGSAVTNVVNTVASGNQYCALLYKLNNTYYSGIVMTYAYSCWFFYKNNAGYGMVRLL